MARKKTKLRNGKISSVIALIVVIAAVLTMTGKVDLQKLFDGGEKIGTTSLSDYVDSNMYVHFIDVGQGTSTLVQKGTHAILIDAGEAEYGNTVVDYIMNCGVKTLDYVVASHPHSDHIGGLPAVINAFNVGSVIMPELSEINTPTTKTYENLLNAIQKKNIDVYSAEFGDEYTVDGVTMTILGPIEQDKDLNDMSVICKVTFQSHSFMIIGDAEKDELKDVAKMSGDFSSDVMTMGHHGSRTSIYESFLSRVNAKAAVISCGKDNSYGHPHEEVLTYLKENNIDFYRTDKDGTIVFSCDKSGCKVVK